MGTAHCCAAAGGDAAARPRGEQAPPAWRISTRHWDRGEDEGLAFAGDEPLSWPAAGRGRGAAGEGLSPTSPTSTIGDLKQVFEEDDVSTRDGSDVDVSPYQDSQPLWLTQALTRHGGDEGGVDEGLALARASLAAALAAPAEAKAGERVRFASATAPSAPKRVPEPGARGKAKAQPQPRRTEVILGRARNTISAGEASPKALVTLQPSSEDSKEDLADDGSFGLRHRIAPPDEITVALRRGAVILDLRSAAERQAEGFLEGSVHAEWDRVAGKMALSKLPPDVGVFVLHDSNGIRAAQAKEFLLRRGYDSVLNAGGPAKRMQWATLIKEVGVSGCLSDAE